MFDTFSTREVTIGTYGLIVIILACTNRKIRLTAIDVVKAACQRPFLVTFFWAWVYAIAIIYCMYKLHLWKWVLLKDVFLWVIFVGVPTCFKAAWKRIDEDLFRNMILDNLKFTVFLEFIISSFTFSLPTEMVIQPILLVLISLQLLSGTTEEWKLAKIFFDIVISIISVVFLGFSFKTAIQVYSHEGVADYLIAFCVPVVLSVCYCSLVYALAVRSKYRSLFGRITIRGSNNKKMIRKRKMSVVLACGVSYKKVCAFDSQYCRSYILTVKSDKDDESFMQFLDEFKKRCRNNHLGC